MHIVSRVMSMVVHDSLHLVGGHTSTKPMRPAHLFPEFTCGLFTRCLDQQSVGDVEYEKMARSLRFQ